MMTLYDDTMRTIFEIPDDKVKELDRLCKAQKISRAELVRRAIDKYLLDTPLVRREASFGIWKKKKIDSLKFETSIRKEWT
jgi:metal-responsive CopG/Arc/MetJ family transcriptional regulator